MGKYYCPKCSTGTDVIETRVSYSRVKRRRQCPNPDCKDRFTTVEVPHDTPKKLKSLADWFGKQGLDPEFVAYAKAEIDSIVLGKGEEEDDDTPLDGSGNRGDSPIQEPSEIQTDP